LRAGPLNSPVVAYFGGPASIDLTAAGAPGCRVHVAPFWTSVLPTDAIGRAGFLVAALCWRTAMHRSIWLVVSLLLASAATAQSKNLLFYGNSLTYYVWGYGVPEMVQKIAIEAGHPSPFIRTALVGGHDLHDHATDPAQVAVISNTLPPGQTWDSVVMQGHYLDATDQGGFSSQVFRSAAVTILTNTRNHSPAARAVMYQTWATAQGHWHYPIPWATPMDMHNEIRGNYRLSVHDLRTAFGAGAATNAAVGDAVALLEWNPVWYEPDKFHPNPATILLAAMCIYTSIYGQGVCEIQPNFSPPGPVALALAPYGLGEADWNRLAGIADTCADPAVRRFPGSGDHLLLESGTGPGPTTACPTRTITAGTFLQLRLRSLNGVFDGVPGCLLIHLFPTGSPPGPWLTYPEVRANPSSMLLVNSSGSLATPMALSLSMPFSWPGYSFLVQGLAFGPSTETGNPWLTATDAHELVFF
jgi:hypothetical protein